MVTDWVVLGLYLTLSVSVGLYAGRGLKTVNDFFSGEKKLPVWAVTISIVATETSALTFLSIPGLAYAGNFTFLQVAAGYIIGRIAISIWLIPKYAGGEILSVYQWIGARFGSDAQRSVSSVFMITRILADGVRIYATAIPLILLLKSSGLIAEESNTAYALIIGILGIITIFYTVAGGIRAVIWTDVIQWIVYVSGGLLALYFIADSPLFSELDFSKLTFLQFQASNGSFFSLTEPYLLINGLIGGILLSMASHGTDQIIVQRVLCTSSVKKAQTALISSGIIVFFQFLLFLIIGWMLEAIYRGSGLRADAVFSTFIVNELPDGLAGVIIAAVIAAAMSTISSSINALASSSVSDWGKLSDTWKATLAGSRLVSVFWGIVLTLVAIGLVLSGGIFKEKVVELGLGIASITYGPVLGIFLMGLSNQITGRRPLIYSLLITLSIMAVLVFTLKIAWTLFTLTGLLVFLVILFLLKRFIHD